MYKEINTEAVPRGKNYSHAVRAGDIIFTTGQVPVDSNGDTVGTDLLTQARQVFSNLKAVLSEAGADLSDVVKTTMYLTDVEAVGQLAGLREEVFGPVRPASVAIEVPRLWDPEHLIEIDVIAVTETT
ncbi:RidA family protein [Arthrobacter sp. NyZ413]|uniref:RidA family protein n=1 Tax=Arthrobacter sp. NyZ413 TaxID=3144669 RepID=UPI003BF7C3DC